MKHLAPYTPGHAGELGLRQMISPETMSFGGQENNRASTLLQNAFLVLD